MTADLVTLLAIAFCGLLIFIGLLMIFAVALGAESDRRRGPR